MAEFELNIYGSNDEIKKTFSTSKVRWGIFMQALELNDTINEKSAAEQFEAINKFIYKIFPDLTEAELENADYNDVLNTFKQLINKARAIGGKGDKKNSKGTV